MKLTIKNLFLTLMVAGMVASFLLTQSSFYLGFMRLTNAFYSVLPNAMADFLRGQTLLAITLFWFFIFLGFGIWLIKGDFFAAEIESRREQFDIVDDDSTGDDPHE